MGAEVVNIDPGAEAWRRVENDPMGATITDRRAAAIFAATRTAEDPTWFTLTRAHRIYTTIPTALAAYQGVDAAWADLVAACKGGFGSLMWRAVELLVYGTRP